MQMMRLFNFHVAQWTRPLQHDLLAVGSLDEAGLSGGWTPNGTGQSGFPNWDEESYYRAHGWAYSNDPAMARMTNG